MENNLSDYRKSYENSELLEGQLPKTPFALFDAWFQEADREEAILEPNTMTLATVDRKGVPRGRIVLLKSYDKAGFVFYSNYESDKGQALQDNPVASLSFFWPALERQVIIVGAVERLSQERSQAYYQLRPRGSQLGAWASNQSETVPDRTFLEGRLQHFEEKFEGKEIPMPTFWGGFIVQPKTIEFWQGRPNRLHDRIEYQQEGEDWKYYRKAP